MMNINKANDIAFTSGALVGAYKGCVDGLGNNEYHSLKSYWSSTDLKAMSATSPAHFYDKYYGAGKNEIKKQTESMILGSMVHSLILTPLEFYKEFFLMPELNLRSNEGKETKERLLKENPGKMAFTEEMLIEAQEMASAAMNHHSYKRLFDGLKKELSFFWTCPFSNLKFKAKLDAASSKHFVEVKTTASGGANPDLWASHLFKMNYDLSLIHYREGVRQVMDISLPAFFIVIERPEYPGGNAVVQDYEVDSGCWDTGHQKWLDAVTKLSNGLQKKEWPGYYPVSNESPKINPPAWAISKTIQSGAANEF